MKTTVPIPDLDISAVLPPVSDLNTSDESMPPLEEPTVQSPRRSSRVRRPTMVPQKRPLGDVKSDNDCSVLRDLNRALKSKSKTDCVDAYVKMREKRPAKPLVISNPNQPPVQRSTRRQVEKFWRPKSIASMRVVDIRLQSRMLNPLEPPVMGRTRSQQQRALIERPMTRKTHV